MYAFNTAGHANSNTGSTWSVEKETEFYVKYHGEASHAVTGHDCQRFADTRGVTVSYGAWPADPGGGCMVHSDTNDMRVWYNRLHTGLKCGSRIITIVL